MRKDTRVSPLFHTASDEKLGGNEAKTMYVIHEVVTLSELNIHIHFQAAQNLGSTIMLKWSL